VKAFDDQCTGANPRYPLISELKAILIDSYYGRKYQESYDRLRPIGTSLESLATADLAACEETDTHSSHVHVTMEALK
jgi:acetaldehyde dehydrogenase/alcohol dehydrogenase